MTADPRGAALDLDDPSLHRLVRRLVMGRMRVRIEQAGLDEDDVMQEVWVRLIRAQESPRSRYDPSRGLSLSSYLCTVGVSAATNCLRAHRRHARCTAVDPADLDLTHQAAGQEALTPAALDRVLAPLDLPVERAVALRLAAGCTSPEIQRDLDLSESAVAELKERVRALLLVIRDEVGP